MVRPKKTSYDDEIIRVDMQIEKYEASLKALKATRTQLLDQKEKLEINMLHDTIKKSGRSVQDIIQALEQISQRKTFIQPTNIHEVKTIEDEEDIAPIEASSDITVITDGE